jgi:single-stranded-DNA-specific exonuclease
LAGNNGEWHGSGRSIAGFSLAGALAACAEHLLSHGGHDMAAGLRVSADRLPAFTEAFTTLAGAAITPEQMIGCIDIDADADLEELTPDTVRALDRLAPFGQGGHGQGNPEVRLRLSELTLVEPPTPFGATGKHVGLRVRSRSSPRVTRLVGWKWAPPTAGLLRGQRLDAVVSPAISGWDGSVEPHVHDLRVLPPQ